MKPSKIFLFTILLFFVGTIFPTKPIPTSAQDDHVGALDMAWSPDGRWLAVTSDDGAWFYDTQDLDAEPLQVLTDLHLTVVAFDPNEDSLAAIGFRTLDVREWSTLLYDVEAQEIVDVVGTRGPLWRTDIGYTESGHYLYSSAHGPYNGFLYVFDTEIGGSFSVVTEADFHSSSAIVTDEGMAITASSDGFLQVYDLEENTDVPMASYLTGAEAIRQIFLVDETTYLLRTEHQLYTFDTENETLEAFKLPLEADLFGMAFNQAEGLLAVGGNGRWVLMDLEAQTVLYDLSVEGSEAGQYGPLVFDFAFSPDGTKIATMQTDGLITVYDTATGEIMGTIRDFDNAGSIQFG